MSYRASISTIGRVSNTIVGVSITIGGVSITIVMNLLVSMTGVQSKSDTQSQ